MKQIVEIEYKTLISESIFHSLLKKYDQYTDYIQTNYYFTHPLLKQKKYMLRIREKHDQYELTLKRPFKKHLLETNIDLTNEQKDAFFDHCLSNEITDLLEDEGIYLDELKQEFSLTTHRYDIILEEGVLSLDQNQYLNITDYELEFEVEDETKGYQRFLDIISPYSIDYTQNCPSKIKRVYDALEKEG